MQKTQTDSFSKNKRKKHIQIILYILYIPTSIVAVLFLCYHILEDITILMYAPEKWKLSNDIYEIKYYSCIENIISSMGYSIIFIISQLILATFIFYIKSTHSKK